MKARTCSRCKRQNRPTGNKPGVSISSYAVQRPDGKMTSTYLCVKCARNRSKG